jgi:IS5 family transposase
MDIPAWLAHATADAEARGLSGLTPLLETLARSTQALRDADAQFHHPAEQHSADTPADDDDKAAG